MLIGHQKIWQFLLKSAQEKNLPHAFLFYGGDRLGKRKIALDLTFSLLGENHKNNNYPDLIFIEPLAKEIKISQIRNLIWNFSLKPHSAPLKVAIIDQAHTMNEEAQTCLLKTLEEPKGNSLLILITDKIHYLLPTVVSRTQIIKFYPVEEKEIRSYIKKQGIGEAEAEKISKISGGKPGMAVEMMFNNQELKSFCGKIDDLEKISKSTLASRFQYAKDLSEDPKEIIDMLYVWMFYFRNKMIEAVKDGREVGKIKNILKNLQSINFLISTTNVNVKLAMENLMLEL